jgi:cysteine-rich repeat protein
VCDRRDKPVSYTEETGLPKYTGCDPAMNPDCKQVTDVMQGGAYLTLHHSRNLASDEGRGVALFDQFSGYNARRVAQELIDFLNDPIVNPRKVDIRPIALAIADRCVTAANLSDFASDTAQAAFRRFHNVSSFDELVTKTNEARHSLPQRKANLQGQNLKGLIEAEDLNPILPTPENITREIARRSQEGFPLDTLTKFMIDREDYGENTTIALFRFFLEPWRTVQVLCEASWVQTWSMGVICRSETYTFADVFSGLITPPYRSEIIERLTEALLAENKEVSCDAPGGLKTASKEAFDAALPLPEFCGNGIVTPPEQCDDGNNTNGDGCSASCTTEAPPSMSCGDGVVQNPPEQCDDRNTMSFDGCSATCQTEAFFPIQQIFNDSANGCLNSGCHDSAAAGGLNLTRGSSQGNLVNVLSTTCSGKDRVEPNEPANSCLFLKVTKAPAEGVVGMLMPIGLSPLDATEIRIIEDWIKDGALP